MNVGFKRPTKNTFKSSHLFLFQITLPGAECHVNTLEINQNKYLKLDIKLL